MSGKSSRRMRKLSFLVLVLLVTAVFLGRYLASRDLSLTNSKSAINALGGKFHYDGKRDRFSYIVLRDTDQQLLQRLSRNLRSDNVGEIIFSDCLIDFRKPETLKILEIAKHLEFHRCEFAGFKTKGIQLPSVESLAFDNCKVPEEFLTDSFSMRLSRLSLFRSHVTNDAFANLVSYPNLERIHLINNSPLSGVGLNCMSEHLRLEELYLLHSDLSGLDFTDFRSSVQHLDFGGSSISPKEFESTRGFSELGFLNASGTQVGDESMDTIEAFMNLVTLGIADTKVTRESVALLKRLPSLQCLYIDAHLVEPNDFPDWERLPVDADGTLQLLKAEGH